MKHFTREAIFALEPPEVADAMAAALGMVSSGSAIAPIRGHIDLGGGAGTFLIHQRASGQSPPWPGKAAGRANRIFAEHWRAAGDP